MKSIASVAFFTLFLTLLATPVRAQFRSSSFWDRVSFGGGLGLNFGDNYFAANIAPSAVYNFNPYFAVGPGLSYSYVKNGSLKSSIVGGSIIALANPLPIIQLSAEFEELYVSQNANLDGSTFTQDFWNSAVFLGAGYRSGSVTIGARYNVLYNDRDAIYTSAVMPFIRFYF